MQAYKDTSKGAITIISGVGFQLRFNSIIMFNDTVGNLWTICISLRQKKGQFHFVEKMHLITYLFPEIKIKKLSLKKKQLKKKSSLSIVKYLRTEKKANS